MKKQILSFMCSAMLLSACTTSSIHKLSNTTGSLSLKEAAILDAGLVQNINDLAFLIQDESSDKNVFMSSLSIYVALAMASHGTAGNTYKQFADLLIPANIDQAGWFDQLRALQGNLNVQDPVIIKLANSLWMREDFKDKVKPAFLQRNQDYFGAMIAAMDFAKDSALDEINGWVEKNTNNLIKKTLDKIDPSTVMFLINTIYFKADWLNQFDKAETKDGIFHGKTDVTVSYMNQTSSFNYYEDDAMQAILLPYKGNKTGMVVVLGKDETAPITTSDMLNRLLDDMQSASVTLKLPKVDLATKEILNDKLIAMGLSDAFTGGGADFSELSEDGDLYIAEVLHKARLMIDEKGTEAAAVTVIDIRETSIEIGDYEMTVDRPYQIFIVDLENKLILFNGIIQDVSAKE
ncbi:MAG: hypothetical protein A2Y20_01565 [Firmicutes bacterium GWF2_51_9]|nr:MAG: hypothetical protein A2Y20_01565 [Firmicutes bacterium GWF2_51_9]